MSKKPRDRKNQAKTPSKEMPSFDYPMAISIPSFVVDRHGQGWWIDPERQTVRKA